MCMYVCTVQNVNADRPIATTRMLTYITIVMNISLSVYIYILIVFSDPSLLIVLVW